MQVNWNWYEREMGPKAALINCPFTTTARSHWREWWWALQTNLKMKIISQGSCVQKALPRARRWLWVSTWWRHQMETFSALLALCAGNSSVTGEFPTHKPVTRGFYVFFDLRVGKRLRNQSWGWWFETPSRPLWCHCNEECRDDHSATIHQGHQNTWFMKT